MIDLPMQLLHRARAACRDHPPSWDVRVRRGDGYHRSDVAADYEEARQPRGEALRRHERVRRRRSGVRGRALRGYARDTGEQARRSSTRGDTASRHSGLGDVACGDDSRRRRRWGATRCHRTAESTSRADLMETRERRAACAEPFPPAPKPCNDESCHSPYPSTFPGQNQDGT
jgi:hypothetical protein